MLKFKRQGDQVTAVDVTDVPVKGIRPTHWDEIANDLSAVLGGTWRVVKLSNYWIIFDQDATPRTRSSRGETTSLVKAIGLATGLPVIKKA